MPAGNEGPEDIVLAMGMDKEKHGDMTETAPLTDPCLSHAQEVEPDSKELEENMVKTVPFAVAIPSTQEQGSEGGSEGRFTPVTEKSPTPVQSAHTEMIEDIVPEEEEGEEIFIKSRPSSTAPPRLRSAGKEKKSPPETKVQFQPAVKPQTNLMNLWPKRKTPQPYLSFKELTAEFDRMLKPLKQQMTSSQTAGATSDDHYYDTSGDCTHPVLAVEPRNPSTPSTSFKIHKQRTVLKPGYTYVEPVLLDLPIDPDTLTTDGLESILDIAANMKPIPPRIDNFTHHPPSRHMCKPCYYVPRVSRPPRQAPPPPVATAGAGSSSFGAGSKCSSAKLAI